MKPVKSGKHAVDYFATSDAGYYSADGGLRCEWGGKAAAQLGLSGTPELEQFSRLVHGLNPHTGGQLTARLSDDRVPAWDVTASIPKGVTLALEGGDERIHAAMWEAFREAMGELEGVATTRVRQGGQQADRVTQNLLYYAVEHAETRPSEDPSLPEDHPWRLMPLPDRHIHGVIPNLTWDETEQKWKAIKFRPVMDLRKFFDRTFDSLLASKLSALGYDIETKWKRDERGGTRYFTWDIAGMPGDAVARNSRRTAEVDATEAAILAGMEAEHGSAPERLSTVARDQLGATSRHAKREDVTLADCRAYWDSLLRPEEKAAIAALIELARSREPVGASHAAAAAVSFALAHHAERRSVIPYEELAVTAMERSLGAASPDQIAAEIHAQAIVVEQGGKRLVTTEALQAEEDFIVGQAHPLIHVAPLGVPEGLRQGRLNAEQWQAVRGLLSSPCRVCVLEGPAGAGKSTLLQKYDEGVRMAGGKVTFLATTSTATDVLRADGFKSETLARLLVDRSLQDAARGGRVVIDEASMLGHKDAVRLFQLAKELDLKLVCVGDPLQHSSVPRGAFLHLLKTHAGIRPFTLSDIQRQQDTDYLQAARLLSTGDTLAGLGRLAAKGWLQELPEDGERYGQIAADYLDAVRAKQSVLVVSPSHAEGARIQDAIRAALRADGRLGLEEREFTRLVASDASEAERGLEGTYRKDDIIQFFQNVKGFKKGARLKVTSPKAVPLSEKSKFQLYRPVSISLSEGDRIRFTSTVKTLDGGHTLKNGATRTVAGFDAGGNIRLDNGWVVSKDAGHFRHAFCETSMGAQGQTVQRVILGLGSQSLPAMSQEQLYVSATRGRQSIRLYTDDATALREAVSRSSQKAAALDLKPKPEAKPTPLKPTLRQRVWQWMERRKRLRYAQAWEPQARGLARPEMPLETTMMRQAEHGERMRARQPEREAGYGR